MNYRDTSSWRHTAHTRRPSWIRAIQSPPALQPIENPPSSSTYSANREILWRTRADRSSPGKRTSSSKLVDGEFYQRRRFWDQLHSSGWIREILRRYNPKLSITSYEYEVSTGFCEDRESFNDRLGFRYEKLYSTVSTTSLCEPS